MNRLIDEIEKYAIGPAQNDDPAEITGRFSFDRSFTGFSGHFPGYPILPAVVQLLLAQLLVEKQTGCRVRVTKIVKAKFLSEIRPDDPVTVRCADAATDEIRRSRVKISCGERPVSSFFLNYTLKENIKC